jgi:hypothetical protein
MVIVLTLRMIRDGRIAFVKDYREMLEVVKTDLREECTYGTRDVHDENDAWTVDGE